MRPIRRILVAVKDVQAPVLPALSKAAHLARALGAELEIFHALTATLYEDVYGVSVKSVAELAGDMRAETLERLESIAAPLRNAGLRVTTGAEWDFPACEAIVREALRSEADLIVAEPHSGQRIAPLLLHVTDWELLRLSPLPVLLVKSSREYENPAVLASVDPSHQFAKPAALDAEILTMAASVSRALGGTLHAMHAYLPPPLGMFPASAVNVQVAAEMDREASETARADFESVLAGFDIPERRRHLIASPAPEAIPLAARRTHTAIVVMGAVSRSGLRRVFIGNTAERTLDALDCDVLVVKPVGFTTSVQSEPRGPRYGVVAPMMPV